MLYLRLLFGDVISLAVIRMRISTIVRVLSQAISCWICRGWSRTVVGYCPRIFPFVYRENCLEIKILKWYIYKFPYKKYTHTHTHTHTHTSLNSVWFLVSAAKWMRTVLFWVVTQRLVVISCRRFGTTYRSHLPRSKIQKEPWRLDRQSVPKRP